MNCPQCNTELPNSASFCHKCGSSIRSDSFTYLPAGTPPWPISEKPGESSSYAYGFAGLPIQTVQAAKETPGTPSAPEPAKPKRSARGMLLILGILALSTLVGVGVSLGFLWSNGELNTTHTRVRVPAVTAQSLNPVTPTPTVQGTALPTPTAFHTVSSTDMNISMKYPSDWTVTGPQQTSPQNFFVDFAPQQRLGIELILRRISASTSASLSSTAQVNQANLTDFSTVQGVQNLQATANAQDMIGGVQWDEQDATFTANQNAYHYVTIAVQHKKTYYSISFFAPDAVYTEAIQKYIQPMLDSFKFLS